MEVSHIHRKQLTSRLVDTVYIVYAFTVVEVQVCLDLYLNDMKVVWLLICVC